ncbi:MAG: hypothetical protein H6Q13_3341 [Bacteroidetes bacterium]|nr:hypothetical protein [Bacteroidota bacterium]
MKNAVLERVMRLIQEKSKSKRDFASTIGMEQTTVNNQLLGKRSISFDLISNILEAFPSVSSEWLLRGIGDMEISEIEKDQTIEELKEELAMLKGENRVLREQLGLQETKGHESA